MRKKKTERDLEVTRLWRKTPKGVLCDIYLRQCRSSVERNMPPPDYTRDEFISRYLADDKFLHLHRQWANSGYTKNLKPSVDRINPLVSYTFTNIQWLTWGGNNAKGYKELLVTRSTSVRMLSKEGNVLAIFSSLVEAGKHVGTRFENIYKCCNGVNPTAAGYRWEYTGQGRIHNKDYTPLSAKTTLVTN